MLGTQLAQSRPSNTNAVSAYSPATNEVTHITEIAVCNTTAISATFRIFHDEDGTTYNESTALFYDVSIGANTTVIIETNWWMRDSDGNLAVRTGTSNALTFTISGDIQAA